MLPLPERILAAFQDAADGLADARPQDSVPIGALKVESYRDLGTPGGMTTVAPRALAVS